MTEFFMRDLSSMVRAGWRQLKAGASPLGVMMVERKLTYGFLLALAIQTGAALLWAGAAMHRIEVLEKRVEAAQPVAERLARVEAQIEAVRSQLDRIETKVDRL